MLLSDFDYDLPQELIAEQPLAPRSASRLLCLEQKSGTITHYYFRELPHLLTPQDLIVLNNTKVIPARLYTYKGTGGKVELLLERMLANNQLLAQAKASKLLKLGERLYLAADIWFEVIDRPNNLWQLLLHAPDPLSTVLANFGQVPLPPYIKHPPTSNDTTAYQTIYAKHPGAIAAPTAGLHFDHELMQNLAKRNIPLAFITLHVGAGTFQPVRTTNITEHKMHAEYVDVPNTTCNKIIATKKSGGKVVTVGTTSLRALEAASHQGTINPYQGDTSIFIYPGYHFHDTDILITNFHLPKTSLLMLVCAFAGYENTMRAYKEAIKQKYRFYSYGDAMIIIP